MMSVSDRIIDYQDMQFRDPEDRATGITVGAGRAILSNRISHFFNIKGARYAALNVQEADRKLTFYLQ